MFFLFGTSDYTSRLSAAIFGAAIVLLPLLLRRWLGTVGTIAAVAFLASNEAGYVTGQVINVNGGMYM